MALQPHIELAEAWLRKTQQRESRNEVECRFRKWIQRQVLAGHDVRVASKLLARAIAGEPLPCWRFSRELLDVLGELKPPGEIPLPAETRDQRDRRKAATRQFLGGPASDHELSGGDVAGAERDQLNRDRLSADEAVLLDGVDSDTARAIADAQRDLEQRREYYDDDGGEAIGRRVMPHRRMPEPRTVQLDPVADAAPGHVPSSESEAGMTAADFDVEEGGAA